MRRLIVLLCLFVLGLAALRPDGALLAQSDQRCFPETGYCISGPIRQYWERNGGLPVFGYPITPLQTETIESWVGPTQWFERDRLEDHSNERKGVLAGRLGVERLIQQGRPWVYRQLGGSSPDCIGFRETGYYLCGGFRTYWERNGGLERFGYPITEQIGEVLEGRQYTVQYFERRRMEYHPEQPGTPVLLGLLGREIRQGGTPPPAPTATPPPTSQQIFIDTPAENAIVSSPMRVSGRTARFPLGGRLNYRVFEPNGSQLASGSITVAGQASQPGAFASDVAFQTPVGGTITLELSENDPTSGGVIARTQRTLRVQAPAVQSITIDEPRGGSRIGVSVVVRGRTTRYPSEGDLYASIFNEQGITLTGRTFPVAGSAGQPASFAVELNIPDQGGRPVTIQVLDIDSRGNVLASATVLVYAGTGYPR